MKGVVGLSSIGGIKVNLTWVLKVSSLDHLSM